MSGRALKLGTRRSALARAQSAAVARLLERAHPGLHVQLVGIDTRGDRVRDRPLSDVEGKEFFTAEIDAALLAGAVDFTVHSYKDLSLERTSRFRLAAVPPRARPHDIILFAPDAPARALAGETLVVGSSSPRRASFVPEFLRQALPGAAARLTMRELRGNVDTRLRRLHEPRGSDRHLDAVVLALAGLARLWADPEGHALLREVLAGLPRMVLPLCCCPSAPAQGALAVECRLEDATTARLLAALDDVETRVAIDSERALLAERGGGCHQRFGATRVAIEGLSGSLLYLREADERSVGEPQLRWSGQPRKPEMAGQTAHEHRGKQAHCGYIVAWDGSREPPIAVEPIAGAAARVAGRLADGTALFITHRRALPRELDGTVSAGGRHVWVPGLSSWRALAERGIWVEGCAEGLGFEALTPLLSEPVLGLPALDRWLVLTHLQAAAHWPAQSAIATYRLGQAESAASSAEPDTAATEGAGAGPPTNVTHVYWQTPEQYRRWRARLPAGVQHACGPGRTGRQLRSEGLEPLVIFPSAAQWREWVGP